MSSNFESRVTFLVNESNYLTLDPVDNIGKIKIVLVLLRNSLRRNSQSSLTSSHVKEEEMYEESRIQATKLTNETVDLTNSILM